jgi:hypothetical protein
MVPYLILWTFLWMNLLTRFPPTLKVWDKTIGTCSKCFVFSRQVFAFAGMVPFVQQSGPSLQFRQGAINCYSTYRLEFQWRPRTISPMDHPLALQFGRVIGITHFQ